MMWMVRKPEGQQATELLNRGVVGIGWGDVAPHLTGATTPADFYAAIAKTYPDQKDQQIVNAGRQLYKFFHEMKEGDTVVTYDSPRRVYHIGTLAGGVTSKPEEEPFS